MNRKRAGAAVLVLGVSLITGCGQANDGSLGSRVMHPNMLVLIRCGDHKRVSVTTLLITGTSDPSRQPIIVTPTTSGAGQGCHFHLKAKTSSDQFVVASIARGSSMWHFTATLTANGLKQLSSQKAVPSAPKGGEYRVYVQTNSLPKTDSFDSRLNWTGGATTKGVKNYNRRVAQMNALRLNKLAGITYTGYGT